MYDLRKSEALANTIQALEALRHCKIDLLDREPFNKSMVDVLLILCRYQDTANDFVLTIADDGITVDVIKTKVIANNVTVQGDLTVTGGIIATHLHVEEILTILEMKEHLNQAGMAKV